MLGLWLFDNLRLLSNIVERAWHSSNTEALAMSAGSWSDQALIAIITLSDERSGAYGMSWQDSLYLYI